MNNDKYYVLIVSVPHWAGPHIEIINEPDLFTTSGKMIKDLEDLEDGYIFELEVESKVKEPLEYPPLDVHTTGDSIIFSSRLIALLQEHGIDNIQYLDADVTYKHTGKKVDYKVANILGTCEGLDMEKSDLDLSNGFVMAINKMVLDTTKIEGQKLFRLKEKKSLPIIHESIKDAIEKAGITGLIFFSEDEYKKGML